jgi:hypothetical protein
MGEGRGAYRILVGRPEGRRPLGRPRRRWEDNIKMYLQEMGWGAWTGLIWLRIGTGGGLEYKCILYRAESTQLENILRTDCRPPLEKHCYVITPYKQIL